MRNLIICECPSNEVTLFGNLILSKPNEHYEIIAIFAPVLDEKFTFYKEFMKSCSSLKISKNVYFQFSDEEPIEIIEKKVLEYLSTRSKFDRVYTHNIQTENKRQQIIASLVGKIYKEEVWTLAGAGIVEEIVKSDNVKFCRILSHINTYYHKLIASNYICITDVKNISLFQLKQGINLYRYHNGCQSWNVNKFDYMKPWELEVSVFERNRYHMELDSLHIMEWRTIIEVGACEGYFTQLILQEFPFAKITAIEPDRHFFCRLTHRIEDNAQFINNDIKVIKYMSADVIFVSNVLYYLDRVPEEMFCAKANYFVVCHDSDYHEKKLDKEFINRGFTCIYENNLKACLEKMEELLTIKYGANLKIWKKINFE